MRALWVVFAIGCQHQAVGPVSQPAPNEIKATIEERPLDPPVKYVDWQTYCGMPTGMTMNVCYLDAATCASQAPDCAPSPFAACFNGMNRTAGAKQTFCFLSDADCEDFLRFTAGKGNHTNLPQTCIVIRWRNAYPGQT